MGKIKIDVTVEKTDLLNQYRGKIIATSEEGKKIIFNFVCKNPLLFKKEINIKLIDSDNKESSLKGSVYSNDLFKDVSEIQKYLILFSFDIIMILIERMINFPDIEESISETESFGINEIGMNLIFG